MLKRLMVPSLLCFVCLCLSAVCPAKEPDTTACKPTKQRFYDDRERGWFFNEYCEPRTKHESKSRHEKQKYSQNPEVIDWAKLQDPSYLESLDAVTFKTTFEQVKNDVVYHPTKEKMLVYLQLQDYMKTKSIEFAYIWRDVLLDHPELDSTFKNPASNYGAMAANSIRNQENRKIMEKLKDEIGLFFFVSGECPYCHEEAKIVNLIVADYGMTIRTISSDYCSSEFVDCVIDPVLFEKLDVKGTPTVVAVYRDPKDNPQIQAIATGIVTEDDLVNRLVFYYKYFKTGKYPS
jgi:conjugal transfer pilus assembly protein TraF